MIKKIFYAVMCYMLFVLPVSALTASNLVGGSSIYHTSDIASIQQDAATKTTTITTTSNQYYTPQVNWTTLNVNSGETLNFNFAGLNQTVLNYAHSGLTTIAGMVKSSGVGADTSRVVICNPNGILLDRGGYINTNSVVLVTENAGFAWTTDAINGKLQYIIVNPNFLTTPNSGLLVKGDIKTNTDVTLVSRGLRVEGANIQAGGNVNLITAEKASLVWGGPVVTKADGTKLTTNDGNLVFRSIGTYSDGRSDTNLNPLNINYIDGVKSLDNISVTQNSFIKSGGNILFNDYRTNNAGINVDGATMLASNGINMVNSSFVKINNLSSDRNTDLKVVLGDSQKESFLGTDYYNANKCTASISNVPEIKSVTVDHIKNNTNVAAIKSTFAQSVTIDKVNSAQDVNIVSNITKSSSVTNTTIGNNFAAQEAAQVQAQNYAQAAMNYAAQATSYAQTAESIQAQAESLATQAAQALVQAKSASTSKEAQVSADLAEDLSNQAATLLLQSQAAYQNAQNASAQSQTLAQASALAQIQAATKAKTDAQAAQQAASLAQTQAQNASLAQDSTQVAADSALQSANAASQHVNVLANAEAKATADAKAKIASRTENEISKIVRVANATSKDTKISNAAFAQNIKGFAANESNSAVNSNNLNHLYKRTPTGFTILAAVGK